MVIDGKAKGRGKGKRPPAELESMPHAFKVLCPEELVSSIMGHGGRTKDQIQGATGCKLVVSQRDEHFAGTRLRMLTIFHEDSSGICAALKEIVDRVVECAEREKTLRPHNEPDFSGKEPGEYIFRVAVSPRMSGAIIGPKGSRVQDLRKRCSARISIDQDIQNDHQQLKIIAAAENLVAALEDVNGSVQEEFDKDWFKVWVGTSGCQPAFQDGGWPGGDWDVGGDWDAGHGHSGGHNSGWRKGHAPPTHESSRQSERERSPRRSLPARPVGAAPEPLAASQPVDREDADAEDLRMLDVLHDVASDFPSEESFTMDIEISAEFPREKVSGLIGNKGAYIQSVRRTTNTQIHFEDSGSTSSDNQRMRIRGPPFGIYKAHMLMMKRYHEMEQLKTASGQHGGAAVQGGDGASAELQRKVQELERQLAEARGEVARTKGQGQGSSAKWKTKL